MSINDSANTTTYTVRDQTAMYGIWIPGSGWLRGKEVFADYSLEKSRQVARMIGRGAIVRFIDPSIVDFEQRYLENEKRKLWHIFKNFFDHKNNK